MQCCIVFIWNIIASFIYIFGWSILVVEQVDANLQNIVGISETLELLELFAFIENSVYCYIWTISFPKELPMCHIDDHSLGKWFHWDYDENSFLFRCAWHQGKDHVALGPDWEEWPTHTPAWSYQHCWAQGRLVCCNHFYVSSKVILSEEALLYRIHNFKVSSLLEIHIFRTGSAQADCSFHWDYHEWMLNQV